MAFISKLLATRNTKNSSNSDCNQKKCNQEHNLLLCQDVFTLAVDQIQVAVFRECDFRGRKLLFDSKSVTRVNVENNRSRKTGEQDNNGTRTRRKPEYIEVSKGFGYILEKPNSDISQLAEMVFGSVSMTFRGTLHKIHRLDLPPRLVLSQIFPSPRVRNTLHHSSTATSKSVDHSMRLNDTCGGSSGVYSSQSSGCTDHSNSDRISMGSDTLFICRRRQFSAPLDVPLNSSLISSSGYGGDLSTSSLSSGPPSMSIDDCYPCSQSFSEDAFHEDTQRCMPSTMCLEDGRVFRHRRSSKLGLAVILEISKEQERNLHEFLMQHIAIIESLLKRMRQEVEIAYIHHQRFVSTMYEASLLVARWVMDLLTIVGNRIHLWQRLNNYCDVPISINCDTKHLFEANLGEPSGLRSFTKKLFKMDKRNSFSVYRNTRKCDYIEKFLKDLCELVEKYDVKHTNFFFSTLMTGVLTHHLGWVTTILPKEEVRCNRPANLMVRQLCDLFGYIGNSSKIAHTIIIGQSDEEMINKFINVLTYFIRCSEIENLTYEYSDDICTKNIENTRCQTRMENPIQLQDASTSNIPTPQLVNEGFSNLVANMQSFQINSNNNNNNQHSQGLSATKKKRTCVTDLSKLDDESNNELTRNVCQLNRSDMAKVVFVLGADEPLANLKESVVQEEGEKETMLFNDCDFMLNERTTSILQTSPSSTQLTLEGLNSRRAQSEGPSCTKMSSTNENLNAKTTKYRYSGVKFNFQQYPQIFENYMKSKNIEMHLHKEHFSGNPDECNSFNFSKFSEVDDTDDDEPLQTPSNATELEYISDLIIPTPSKHTATAKVTLALEAKTNDFVRRCVPNACIMPANHISPLVIMELPMLPCTNAFFIMRPLRYTTTLIRSCSENYIPNMALQGLISAHTDHEMFKRDLSLSAKFPFLGGPAEESIAVIGNINSWTVSLISSHTYVIDKSVNGIPIGMSHLVANMLETLLRMWKLHTPPEYCLMHIEQKLSEFCIQSKAVAQMLLDTDYCNIDLLASTLKLEVNDVPLLMAVASIHTPEVSQKYGLRFQ